MLELNYILNHIEKVEEKYKARGFIWDRDSLLNLAQKKKTLQIELEKLKNQVNKNAQEIGQNKNDITLITQLKINGEELKNQTRQLEQIYHQIEQQLTNELLNLPNIPQDDVPIGHDEKNNKEIMRWGEPIHEDWHKEHDEVGLQLGLEAELGAKLSGARFTVLRKNMARLHRALIQFMLQENIDAGYEEVYIPYLVKEEAMKGTGQLPKFQEDMFYLEKDGLYLIPTAEVPVTNLLAKEMIDANTLPLSFVAHTPCFRREVGSAGRDTKGMIRQHQFDKVELVKFAHPNESEKELEKMVGQARHLLEKLKLPYRQVLLCTGDMGFGSTKTYDLEVWLPGQNAYREISSVTNFHDFQARRMGLRAKEGKNKFIPHTLNGSALAVGRTLVAILENYQQEDGSVLIPDVLQPWMGGIKKLERLK